MFQTQKGFTLVELIVVITILAILGTIGFISMQGYSQSAREATRVSDLTTIEKALVFFHTTENYFPEPSDFISVTFSGSLAWKQGSFWEDTRLVTGRISESPRDPLTNNLYAYSVTNNRQEFELWAISETPLAWLPSLTNTSYAANNYYTNIVGNYNKKIVTVKEPTRLYILWVPTLITSEITDVTVQDIISNWTFSIKNSKSLPASYATALPNEQTLTDWVSFVSGPVANSPILYDGNTEDLSGPNGKQTLWENLKSYYAESNIKDDASYTDISNIESGQEYQYVNTLVQSNVAWLSSSSVNVSSWTPTNITAWNPVEDNYPDSCLEMSSAQLANLNNWADVSLWTDRGWNPDGSAEFFIGTSSLTREEWCGINSIETYGDEFSGRFTYIPEEFWFLENLEYIIFQNHDIQSLPESLVLLNNLRDVDFTGNTQLGNLARPTFEWYWEGSTCEANVSDNGENMCMEISGWEFEDTLIFTLWWEAPAWFTGGDIPFLSIWKTDNTGDSNDNQITIPVGNGSLYNFDITWNSVVNPAVTGTISGRSTETVITFPAPWRYYVYITWQYPHMFMDDFYWDAAKIESVSQWGNVWWESMSRMFHRASNLTWVPNNTTWLEWVDDMSLVFSATDSFNQDISWWDVSNVANMTWMFQNSLIFDQDISAWDVDGVTSCFVFTGGSTNSNWTPAEKPSFTNCTPWF